jgi:hypothetical protein
MWWGKKIKDKKTQNFGEFFPLKTLNMQQEIFQIFAKVQNLHLNKKKH